MTFRQNLRYLPVSSVVSVMLLKFGESSSRPSSSLKYSGTSSLGWIADPKLVGDLPSDCSAKGLTLIISSVPLICLRLEDSSSALSGLHWRFVGGGLSRLRGKLISWLEVTVLLQEDICDFVSLCLNCTFDDDGWGFKKTVFWKKYNQINVISVFYK